MRYTYFRTYRDKEDTVKKIQQIPGKWLLSLMLSIFLLTCYFVINSRAYLMEVKEELIQKEQEILAQEEAGTLTPNGGSYVSPESVHVGSAYLWIIPFGIVEFCLLILDLVRYIA